MTATVTATATATATATGNGDGERQRETATGNGNGNGDGDGVESGGHLDEHGHDSVEQGLSSAIGRLIDELQNAGDIEDGTALMG